jgi:hypothetical protein
MKYLKLLALALLVWAVIFSGGLVLSLRTANPDARSAALALLKHNALPRVLQPKTYTYTDHGKTYPTTGANLEAYKKREAQKGILDLVSDEHSVGYMLYAWCTHVLPWLSLLLSLWLLNVAASIKRLADAME